ncbi:MAG: hypothetical protein Q8M56_17965 [Desulfobacterales bacterium]|jgi:hypothetical protein|nr:hypothetical protein [Desulfobacterales bacterium]
MQTGPGKMKMGLINRQIRSEIKLLPYMLGKLAGGFTAVAGFTGAVIVVTRRANPSWPDIWPYLLLGMSGVFIFYISTRLAMKRAEVNDDKMLMPQETKKAGMISWILFLAAALVFILFTYIITK